MSQAALVKICRQLMDIVLKIFELMKPNGQELAMKGVVIREGDWPSLLFDS